MLLQDNTPLHAACSAPDRPEDLPYHVLEDATDFDISTATTSDASVLNVNYCLHSNVASRGVADTSDDSSDEWLNEAGDAVSEDDASDGLLDDSCDDWLKEAGDASVERDLPDGVAHTKPYRDQEVQPVDQQIQLMA